MSAEPERRWSTHEYLAFERQSETKHEFIAGQILAMTGASRSHGRIVWNICGQLYPQLQDRGCEGFAGDMRVHIPVTERYTYPDVVVACGEPQFEDAELDTLLSPTLIIEVLSPSTEDHDRGSKLFHYRSIPSLLGILLIAQDKILVERYHRQSDGGWLLTDIDDPEAVLELQEIDARLALKDVYRGVHEP